MQAHGEATVAADADAGTIGMQNLCRHRSWWSPSHASNTAGDDHRPHFTWLIVMDHEQAVFPGIHGQDGRRIERLIHDANKPLMADRHIIGEKFWGPMVTSRLFAFL